MARARATKSRFVDGILQILREDAQQNPEDWFLVPQTFRRGIGSENQGLPDPVICVSANGTSEPISGPMEGGAVSSRMTLTIYALVRVGNADEAAAEMEADIQRVLMSNRQLRAVDDPNNPTILSGFMRLGTSEISARDGSSEGEAIIEQQVVIQNTWAASAP